MSPTRSTQQRTMVSTFPFSSLVSFHGYSHYHFVSHRILLWHLRGSGFLLSARCPAFSFTCLGFIAFQGSLRADRFGGVTSRGLDLGMVMGYSSAGNTRRFIHFLILYLPAPPCDDIKGRNDWDVFDLCV